jgi:hypothetical protein
MEQKRTEYRIESILKDFSVMMKEEQLISDLIMSLSTHASRNPKFLIIKGQVAELETMLKDVDEHFEELEEILGKVNFDVMTEFHLRLLNTFSEEIDRVKDIYVAEIEKSNLALKELVDFTLEQEMFAKEMNDAITQVKFFILLSESMGKQIENEQFYSQETKQSNSLTKTLVGTIIALSLIVNQPKFSF